MDKTLEKSGKFVSPKMWEPCLFMRFIKRLVSSSGFRPMYQFNRSYVMFFSILGTIFGVIEMCL